jgi:hypothetical protein
LRCFIGFCIQLLSNQDLLEDSLDLIILNQTPEYLSAVHGEKSFEYFLVFNVETGLILENVHLFKVSMSIIEVINVGVTFTAVHKVLEILF